MNELVINLKERKTETMLFGTAKRLSNFDKELQLYYNDTKIRATETYKCLCTTIDSNLSMKTNFDNMYKKTMAKLRMLYSYRKLSWNLRNVFFSPWVLHCTTICLWRSKKQRILSFLEKNLLIRFKM